MVVYKLDSMGIRCECPPYGEICPCQPAPSMCQSAVGRAQQQAIKSWWLPVSAWQCPKCAVLAYHACSQLQLILSNDSFSLHLQSGCSIDKDAARMTIQDSGAQSIHGAVRSISEGAALVRHTASHACFCELMPSVKQSCNYN